MWVIVRGGLGNQMFQVAFATALACRFGVTPKYADLSSRARVARSWSLSCFGIEPDQIGSLTQARLAAVAVLSRKLRLRHFDRLTGTMIELEEFKAPPAMEKAPQLISGYWQGPAYFAGHEAAVRAVLRFPEVPRQWAVLRVANGRQRVAIHVRRGDYVSDPVARAVHLVCDAAWYRNAWDRLRTEVSDCQAIVFSDDAEWAGQNLMLDGDVHYVRADRGRPAWADMAQMSQCQHFIISNSSFSWWAAYLGQSKDSHVIAPARWLQGRPTAGLGICPPSWTLL